MNYIGANEFKDIYKAIKILNSWRYSAILLNEDTGEIYYNKKAYELRYPASLTKLMTLYLTFKALKSGKLKMNQTLRVSTRAAKQPKMNLGLRKGEKLTVSDAIHGAIIRSANCVSVVLAEAIAGNEANFAKMMTNEARRLGMKKTTFKNANGLHHPKQQTTAYDMTILARALRRDFPEYYPLFKKKAFRFRGKIVYGHNKILHRYKSADGLKTGYVNASGFNLVSTATNKNGKLVAVVMGSNSARMRDDHMVKLLDYGYYQIKQKKMPNIQVASKYQSFDLEQEDVFSMASASDIFALVNRDMD